MNRVKCFLLSPTGSVRLTLRRFVSGRQAHCLCSDSKIGVHDAEVFLRDEPTREDERGYIQCYDASKFKEHAGWPTHCACGYEFQEGDMWQVNPDRLYSDENGNTLTWESAPPGAMIDATWYHDLPAWCGPDGKAMLVKLPNGIVWHIDSRASNCTMKEDSVHKCWVRHGEAPNITVDKNGNTCAAGAGSIGVPGYHGFLRNGYLEEC